MAERAENDSYPVIAGLLDATPSSNKNWPGNLVQEAITLFADIEVLRQNAVIVCKVNTRILSSIQHQARQIAALEAERDEYRVGFRVLLKSIADQAAEILTLRERIAASSPMRD